MTTYEIESAAADKFRELIADGGVTCATMIDDSMEKVTLDDRSQYPAAADYIGEPFKQGDDTCFIEWALYQKYAAVLEAELSDASELVQPSDFIPVFTSDEIPDTTYFRVSDVQPEFADLNGTINPSLDDRKAVKVWSGIGTYRSSWGAPKVTSTVLVNDPNLKLLCIHVGFSHKHRGNQFYRYYTTDMGIVVETSWKRLSNEQRQAVLDAPKPKWAKAPGKLRQLKSA